MFAGPIFVSASKVHAFNNAVHSYEIKQLLRTKTKKKKMSTVTLRLCPPSLPIASRQAPAVNPERHATRLPPTHSVT